MLAQNIKTFRKERGLSQQELAEKSGASLASVTGWESGRITKIRQGNLEKLAAALDVTVEQLTRETVEPAKPVSELSKAVCRNIRDIRKKRKWKQEDIAEKLGMTKYTYGELENGEVEPDLEQLKVIAEALEVSLDDLFGLEIGEPGTEQDGEAETLERWLKQLISAPAEQKEAMKKVWSAIRELGRAE